MFNLLANAIAGRVSWGGEGGRRRGSCPRRNEGRQLGLGLSLLLLAVFPAACSKEVEPLRLAVTTSTRDSGLLDVLVPEFEQQEGIQVHVISVGTGAAFRLGRATDVDCLIVHDRKSELEFLNEGHATRHEPIMESDFLLVGPASDPLGLRGLPIEKALLKLAEQNGLFTSRGDDSGTHRREMAMWASAGIEPTWDNYIECGRGMGQTLLVANERNAYCFVDTGTFLNLRLDVDLEDLGCSGESLLNPYAGLVVAKTAAINQERAQSMLDFLVSPRGQQLIANFKINGIAPFRPTAVAGLSSP